MKQALGWVVLAIVALVSTACRTPLPRQTLEVGQLEVGMKREAVRALLGEPDWVDEGMTPEAIRALVGEPVGAEDWFPETWPRLRATETGETERVEPEGSSPVAWQGLRSLETWVYEDELVEAKEVGIFAAFSLVLLGVPLFIEGVRLFDDEATSSWVTLRTTWLQFEDERLAGWRAEYDAAWWGRRIERGGEMFFDPEIQAYRVAHCGSSGHGDHCAQYYSQGRFYRFDDNGWCSSTQISGPFIPVAANEILPQFCQQVEAAPQEITDARTEELRAIRKQNKAKLAEFRKAEKLTIRKAERAEIRAAGQEADAKIAESRAAKDAAIEKAKSEPDAKTRKAATRAAKQEHETRMKEIRTSEKAAVQAARQQAKTKTAVIQGQSVTYTGNRGRRGWGDGGWADGSGGGGGGGFGGGSSGGGFGGGSSGGGGGGGRGGGGGGGGGGGRGRR